MSDGGVVFKLAGKKETVLHSFTGGKDGGYVTSLGCLWTLRETSTALPPMVGTLTAIIPVGCGVVFKLDWQTHLTVLHSFKGPPDGA